MATQEYAGSGSRDQTINSKVNAPSSNKPIGTVKNQQISGGTGSTTGGAANMGSKSMGTVKNMQNSGSNNPTNANIPGFSGNGTLSGKV